MFASLALASGQATEISNPWRIVVLGGLSPLALTLLRCSRLF